MDFSKEIIKKDIPLLLQRYFRGKYFDRCGSVHLGAETWLSPRQLAQMEPWDISRVVPSPNIVQMVDCGSTNINIFYATARSIASLWKMVLLLKNDNDHTDFSQINLWWCMLQYKRFVK